MLLKIIKIIQETPDTKTLRLEIEDFRFLPGQFIMLESNIKGRTEKRAYSISSSPSQKNYIEITVKKVKNGLVSAYIHKLNEGNYVEIKGPYGHFIFNENKKNHIFIAAGCGIAPLMSMIRYILDKKFDMNIVLIYSEKSYKYIIYRKELENLQKNKNFRYIFTLTRDELWKGHKGRITQDLIRNNIKNDPLFYISGPIKMVDAVNEMLKNLNIKKEKIKIEKY